MPAAILFAPLSDDQATPRIFQAGYESVEHARSDLQGRVESAGYRAFVYNEEQDLDRLQSGRRHTLPLLDQIALDSDHPYLERFLITQVKPVR